MAELEAPDLPPWPRCYVCGRPWHSTDGSTCIDALKAEVERLRDGIRQHEQAGPHRPRCRPCEVCESADYGLWGLLDDRTETT